VVLIRRQAQHHPPRPGGMLPENACELFCRLFVSEFEKLLAIAQGNMIDENDQLRPTEHGHVIVVDTETSKGPVNTHHKVRINPINSEKLYNNVKSRWIFVLVLTQMFGNREKAVPRKAGGEIKSLISSIRHDFALQ
jgi:hypothetical protein